MKTQITIHDEAERAVVSYALLHLMQRLIGEGNDLDPALWDAGDAAIGRGDVTTAETLQEVDGLLDLLTSRRRSHQELMEADLSDPVTVVIAVGRDELGELVLAGKDTIEEWNSDSLDGGFWGQAPETRLRVLENRDAAVRLAEALGVGVEAVA